MNATWIGSAKTRLLPPAIPFAFFAVALASHLAGWLVLLTGAESAAWFTGGLGPPLAALHLITLGTLAAAAMGAGFQMLPVAAKAQLPALWPCWLSLVLLTAGVPLLSWGMATGSVAALTIGGLAALLALITFAAVLGIALFTAKGLPLVTAHVGLALGSLCVGAVLGLAVTGNFIHGYLAGHRTAAAVHLVLMSFGFLGMLAAGFSQILVPMFALAPTPDARVGYLVLVSGAAALGSLVAGHPGPAALIGLFAALLHVTEMMCILRRRARPRLGLSFILIRLSWIFLPTAVAVGGWATLGDGDLAGRVFVVVMVIGWLLSFVLGVLMRILPFLAAMNAGRAGQRVPKVADLTNVRLQWVLAGSHALAVAFLTAGILLEDAMLVRIAGASGALGATAFILFACGIAVRAGLLFPVKPLERESVR